MFKRMVTLCHPCDADKQQICINSSTKLTVLPAYHDDVISRDQAVGFCLECAVGGDEPRRIVFTGDTGLYPPLIDKKGAVIEYQYEDENASAQEETELDDAEDKALYARYAKYLNRIKPDLLVAHIGSIKEKEFLGMEVSYGALLKRDSKPTRRLYVNHLGLLGTLVLMHKLAPKAAVISEFGAELKDFRIELVQSLAKALADRQTADKMPDSEKTFVVPGDITIAYDIKNHKFLCHKTCEFTDPKELQVVPADNYVRKWHEPGKEYHVDSPPVGFDRVLLVSALFNGERYQYNRISENFFRKLFNFELPFHKPKL